MNLKHGFYLGSLGLAAASFASNAFAQSPPPTFAGPYVGAFGGYGWGHSSQHDNFCAAHPFGNFYCENGPVVTPDTAGLGDGSFGLGGALGGGLVGYNFDYNQFVFGIEGDGAVMDL